MISSSIKEGSNPYLTENHASLDELSDFFNIYPSECCIDCFESCSCLHNYKIVSNEISNDSFDPTNHLFPLFDRSESASKSTSLNKQWYLKLFYLDQYFLVCKLLLSKLCPRPLLFKTIALNEI